MAEEWLLSVEHLSTSFFTDDGVVQAVNDVSFTVGAGETVGIVGESGCGKSITSLSILNMVPSPGRIVGGSIQLRAPDETVHELSALDPKGREIRDIRGRHIGMIFQEPMSSFTPVYSIGWQIAEAIRTHNNVTKQEARERAVELLDYVGISDPTRRYDEYPHEFSGGMRQRAMIAMALSCDPVLLIADEPTTALDVTIEAQILKLLRDIQEERGMSIMLITHDLSVIGEMAGRVMVMYMGKLVERASCDELFYSKHRHPYTEALLKSIPKIGTRDRLRPISGSTPNALALPDGCTFHPRCPYAMKVCPTKDPAMYDLGAEHEARCYLYDESLSEDEKERLR